MPVDQRLQHSANRSGSEPLNITDPLPSASCPFNNFRYGTGIFPGIPPPIEHDPEYEEEQYLRDHIPWWPAPPPAHTTPHHSPKLEFRCVRPSPPQTHSDYSCDL
ncbi:unnamed protein product [Hymenolepis diminuta]|nr:unnamed protein product [Hymenolepis diminuta]